MLQDLVIVLVTSKQKWDEVADQLNFTICARAQMGYLKIDEKRIEKTANKILDELQLSGGEILTDLGCGFCTYETYWSKRVKQIIAIDISPKLLKIAKKRLLHANAINVTVVAGSITHIPLKNEVIDVLLCLGSAKYLGKATWHGFMEMGRITKRGGKIYVNGLMNLLHPQNWILKFKLAVSRLFRRGPWIDEYLYIPWQIENCLKSIGMDYMTFYGCGWKFPATSFMSSILPKRIKNHFGKHLYYPSLLSSEASSNRCTPQLMRFFGLEFMCIK